MPTKSLLPVESRSHGPRNQLNVYELSATSSMQISKADSHRHASNESRVAQNRRAAPHTYRSPRKPTTCRQTTARLSPDHWQTHTTRLTLYNGLLCRETCLRRKNHDRTCHLQPHAEQCRESLQDTSKRSRIKPKCLQAEQVQSCARFDMLDISQSLSFIKQCRNRIPQCKPTGTTTESLDTVLQPI